MKTRPPAMTGVECVSVPSLAIHLMFLPVCGSKLSGRFLSSETMLRDQAWPHCGWSDAKRGKLKLATVAAAANRNSPIEIVIIAVLRRRQYYNASRENDNSNG